MTQRNGAPPETSPRCFGVLLHFEGPNEDINYVRCYVVPNEETTKAKTGGGRAGLWLT